ncbi:endonuclease III [Deltaproteobacteria bacterium OttesenSCG-928-M10]|nr:endonuclease III [Deltaproteobacteria bacterium OttesenSCG-928-M10]
MAKSEPKPAVKAAKPAVSPRAKGPAKGYIRKILNFFDEYYPAAHCSLDFHDPFQLLAATILSAQCTDERVNRTTPALFARFPGPVAMASADPAEVEAIIKPCGFYHNKAKSLIAASESIVRDHSGRVPDTLEELVRLPGVGRKTANVVLGNAFGVPGLTVDTHLGRLSRRLGLSQNTDPEKVEADLAGLIPRPRWTLFSHQAIAHGRALCRARGPLCGQCPFEPSCPRTGVDG